MIGNPIRHLTDSQIVEGILAGGRQKNGAIIAIYEQNRAFLTRFVGNKGNSREFVKEPSDIVWESIEALIINIEEGKYIARKETPLAAYLTTFCKNIWFKFLESETARVAREDSYGDEQANEIEPDISQLLAQKETWDFYLAVFEKAGKFCQQLFTLWLVDGLSGKEMSDVFIAEGKLNSEQSVRNAKSDCMKRTLQLLTNQ